MTGTDGPGWRILSHDADVLAVAKPQGLLVVPGRGDVPSTTLRHELETHLERPVWVVHRIDRPASGVVLFATSAEAHRYLSMAFEAGRVERTYLCWVLGVPEPLQGSIDLPIREGRKGRMKGAPDGKPARTDYRVLREADGCALLEAGLHTGRRHQIRLHLAYRGHPILVDPLYAGPRLNDLRALAGRLGLPATEPGIRLHAASVAWTAADGRRCRVACDVPPGFDPVP